MDICLEKQELLTLVHQYEKDLSSKFQEEQDQIRVKKFGTGGKSLPRGYFSPSLILDLVTAGVSRGKLQKAIPKTKAYHQFGFDQNERLRTVERHFESAPTEYEWIEYQDQVQFGICFEEKRGVIRVIKAEFDEKGIVYLSNYDYISSYHDFTMARVEQYAYLKGAVSVLETTYGFLSYEKVFQEAMTFTNTVKENTAALFFNQQKPNQCSDARMMDQTDYLFHLENGKIVSYEATGKRGCSYYPLSRPKDFHKVQLICQGIAETI